MAHPRELIMRLGIAGALVALLFIVRLLYQASGPASSHWLYFTGVYIALVVFAAYQVLRAVALVAVSRQTQSSLLQAIHFRGVRGTLWEIHRRRLTPALRLPLILVSCACIVLAVVLILWHLRALEAPQARLIGSLAGGKDSTGIPICRIVTLETPDNNLGRYYRSVATLSQNLYEAGAKIVLAELSRYESPLSQWKPLLDSLARSGVFLYESGGGSPQSLPLPNPAPANWRRARLFDQSRPVPLESPVMVAFRPVPSWYSQQLHCALQVVAALRGERMIQQPYFINGDVRYGDLRIPVTEEGEAYAPLDRRVWKGVAGIAALKEGSDTLLYWDNSRPEYASAMSPAFAAGVRGEVVSIQWFEPGGFEGPWKGTRLLALSSIVEALQRGRLVTPLPGWHHAITIVVLLLGVGLSVGKHLRVAFPVMALVAAALLGADVWLYASQSLLADLVYPAAAALLAGIVFPLATHFHRHP